MPCFFRFVSWMRAKLLVRTTAHPRYRGDIAACSRLEALLATREAVARQLLGLGRREPEGPAVGAREGAVDGIELERAREGERGHDLGTRQEREGRGAAVVPAGEVPVERRHDRVRLVGADVAALPLTDAGAARVREHRATYLRERVHHPVALDRLVDPLRAWRAQERDLRPEPRLDPLRRDVRGAPHVLVRRVRARAA